MAYKRPRASSPPDFQKRARSDGVHHQYVSLGTELPQDENNDDGSFVPVWKQTVTDERGRRRLHGAFTGGFSAGYFNTVGSKEGWAPKAFVSSRANRKKDEGQRAEDFMDEEDLAQAAESRQLETVQSAAAIGRVGEAPGDALFGLFVTEEDSMGVKIAQKMGWRRDQGVGRKVHRVAAEDVDHAGAPSSTNKQLFAPKDAQIMSFPPDDVHRKGLGYRSEARLVPTKEKEVHDGPLLALPYLDPSKLALAKKPPPKKSSLGVGILNDTGSDDEDPYELGPKIIFSKTAGKDKKAKKPSKFAKNGVADKLAIVVKRAGGSTSTLQHASWDQRPPLRGFVIALQPIGATKIRSFPPPSIPAGWKSSKQQAGTDGLQNFQSVTEAARSSNLDAKARASLLGEKLLPGKSVFDFIPKDARDRLANLTGNAALPQGLGQLAPEGSAGGSQVKAKDLWSFVPALDKIVAAGALAKGATGWMPYAEDLGKRGRYVAYLELRAGQRQDLPERAEGSSVAEWGKELQEFAHAAQVFKPTTGIMASRFISSRSSGYPGGNGHSTSPDLLRQPMAKADDPAEEAAKLGMYGAMTRSSFSFIPSRLLCKRFNVKPPPDVPTTAEPQGADFTRKTEEAVSKAAMDQMRHEMLTRGMPNLQRPAWMNDVSTPAVPESVPEAPVPVNGSEHAMVDVEKNEALAQTKASEDVFKAIFGDGDDDGTDEE